MHDWFTQTGQGYGTEYRWMRSATSLGNLRAYKLAQKAATVERRAGARIAQRAGERRDHPGPAVPAQGPRPHRLLVQPDAQPALQPGRLQRHAEPEHLERQRLGLVAVPERLGDRAAHASSSSTRPSRGSPARCPASPPRCRAASWGRCRSTSRCSPRRRSRSTSMRDGDTEFDRSLTRSDLCPTLRMPISRLDRSSTSTCTLHYRTTWYSESLEFDPTGIGSSRSTCRTPATTPSCAPRSSVRCSARSTRPNNCLRRPAQARHRAELQRAAHHQHRRRRAGADAGQLLRPGRRRGHAHDLRADQPRAGAQGAPKGSAALAGRQRAARAADRQHLADLLHRPARQPLRPDLPVELRRSPAAGGRRATSRRCRSTSARSRSRWSAPPSASSTTGRQRKLLSMSTGSDYGSPDRPVAVAWSRSLSSYFPTNTLNGQARLDLHGRPARHQLLRSTGTSSATRWCSSGSSPSTTRSAAGSSCSSRSTRIGSFGGGTPIPKDRRFNLGFTLAGIGTFSNFFGNFGGLGLLSGR